MPKSAMTEVSRQQDILRWAVDTFGADAGSPEERAARFLEEAVEAVQSSGLSRKIAENIVKRVFDRPAGNQAQEIGAALVTLEALAESLGISCAKAADQEWERVRRIPPARFRRRHERKACDGIVAAAPRE